MISLVAPAVFNHVPHERFTVCLDTIGGYSMKYAVVKVPHQEKSAQIAGELLEEHYSQPVVGKIDFVLKADAGENIELIRAADRGCKTVKTPYIAGRDIEAHGVMHYHSYLKGSGVTYVCNL